MSFPPVHVHVHACVHDVHKCDSPQGLLLGNDQHSGALALAQQGVEAAGLQGAVQFREGPCRTLRLRAAPDVVITNPPWGQRLAGGRGVARGRRPGSGKRVGVVEGVDEGLRAVYEELGDWLKASVCVFSLAMTGCLLMAAAVLPLFSHGHAEGFHLPALP